MYLDHQRQSMLERNRRRVVMWVFVPPPIGHLPKKRARVLVTARYGELGVSLSTPAPLAEYGAKIG